MSGFFTALSALAFIAALYFGVQMFRRRPRSGRRVLQAFGATVVFSLLGAFTQTGAERQAAEVSRQAEEQERQTQAVQDAAAREVAQQQRAAEQVARDQAEAERKANTSIEPTDMIIFCEKEARARLKLPDTARFPGTFETADNLPTVGPQGAIWRSWVEGENAFGGKVRDQFTCIYTKSDNSISLEFQGQ